MVKTVLHELVKLRGTAIKGHLSMVPIDSEPQPIILAYIDLNLQVTTLKKPLSEFHFFSLNLYVSTIHSGGCYIRCSAT